MNSNLPAETPKLPLEIMSLILLKLNESNDEEYLEELKKCRLISSRWYKAVQDVFREEFYQKYASHFNGHAQSFSTSRTFGNNIFGFYQLNFATLKISKSEFYLMKTWLGRLILENLQNLELQNNLLNWKELIQVLQHFSNIVSFKFIQSSENIELVENVYHKFRMDLSHFSHYNYNRTIKKHAESLGRFEILSKLKNFQVKVVHIHMLNILADIFSYTSCPAFESFFITIDYRGLRKLCHHHHKTHKETKYSPLYNQLEFCISNFLRNFAKSLRKFEINVETNEVIKNNLDLLERDVDSWPWHIDFSLKFNISYGVLGIFSKQLLDIENLEILKIVIPNYNISLEDNGLSHFIKNLKNLKKFHFSTFSYQYLNQTQNAIELQNYFRNLVHDENNLTRCTMIGLEVCKEFGVFSEFSDNLTKIRIILNVLTNWRFSDANIPKFVNCREISIEIEVLPDWQDFEIPVMIEKFPNLDKISIRYAKTYKWNPKISNEDLQLILGHYENLKYLHLENSTAELFSDSGITGIKSGVVQNRIENPEIMGNRIQPGEKSGFAISNLQNLKSLVIKSTEQINVTDVTAHFAFENMPKLVNLELINTKISTNGFEIIREKCKSKNLTLLI